MKDIILLFFISILWELHYIPILKMNKLNHGNLNGSLWQPEMSVSIRGDKEKLDKDPADHLGLVGHPAPTEGWGCQLMFVEVSCFCSVLRLTNSLFFNWNTYFFKYLKSHSDLSLLYLWSQCFQQVRFMW